MGLYLACKLAEKKQDVNVYEEHKVIGEPVQCTGIVSSEFSKVIELDKDFVVNKLKKVKVFSKNRRVEFDVDDVVIDRAKFDKWLLKKSQKSRS